MGSRTRAVRGGVVATLAVGLAVLAHTSANPVAPGRHAGHAGLAPLSWLALPAVAGWVAVTCFAFRERRPGLLVGTLACAQLALHAALALTEPSTASIAGRLLCTAGSSARTLPVSSDSYPLLSPRHGNVLGHHAGTMLAAHAAAVVACAWWLNRGEAAALAVCAAVAVHAGRAVARRRGPASTCAAAPLPAGRSCQLQPAPLGPRRTVLLRHVAGRRAPPRFA